MTSSDFSLRLWAFSVLSARIWNATSGSGTVIAVGGPVDARPRRHDHDRVDEAVDLLHALLQPFDVSRRKVALIRGRLHLRHGQDAEDVPVIADWIPVERQGTPAILVDLRCESGRGLRRFHIVGIDGPVRHSVLIMPEASVAGKV